MEYLNKILCLGEGGGGGRALKRTNLQCPEVCPGGDVAASNWLTHQCYLTFHRISTGNMLRPQSVWESSLLQPAPSYQHHTENWLIWLSSKTITILTATTIVTLELPRFRINATECVNLTTPGQSCWKTTQQATSITTPRVRIISQVIQSPLLQMTFVENSWVVHRSISTPLQALV